MPRTSSKAEVVEEKVVLEPQTEVASPLPSLNTAEQIARGQRTADFVLLTQELAKKTEGRLESLAIAFEVEKRDDETWRDRIEAIAEAQFAGMGKSSYEAATDVYYGSTVAAIAQKPTPQLYPRGIRVAPSGDKLRTRLYGPGLVA